MRQPAQIARQPDQLLAGFLAREAHHDHVLDRVCQRHHERVEPLDVLGKVHHQQPAQTGVEHAAAAGRTDGARSEEGKVLALVGGKGMGV